MWTLYDLRFGLDRQDRPMRKAEKRAQRCERLYAAPTTAEQLLFLLEGTGGTDRINGPAI